jgi:hypothetical protein
MVKLKEKNYPIYKKLEYIPFINTTMYYSYTD